MKAMVSSACLLMLSIGNAPAVFAHSGGLDANGCHTNRKTGDYHCHRAARPSTQPRAAATRTPREIVATEIDEQIAEWRRQYGVALGITPAQRNAASAWDSCIATENVGEPPHSNEQKARVLRCAASRGFPLR
jgi:hypothetical protein